MPMPRLPDVIGGTGDELERFMGDYLVGMFDEAAPLAIGAPEEIELQHLFHWRGMKVSLVQLPPHVYQTSTDTADVIELDLFNEIERVVGGVAIEAGAMVGIQAVRIPAGVECTRRSGPLGAAWLVFRGVPA